MSPTNPHQLALAAQFRQLHDVTQHPPLVLANAWDAMSARVVEAAGATAIATTSAGVSWALGYADGHGLTREAMVTAVQCIVRAVRIPVSADVESGYGTGTADDVATTVRAVIDAGAVGVNFEDSPGHDGNKMLDVTYQAARFAAARTAAISTGVDLYINARIDTYLRAVGDTTEERFDETVHRAHAYAAAGADSVFVPLVTDAATIKRLVDAVGVPLNVLAGPTSPSIAELRALGVARVSVGPGLARSVMAHIRRAATEIFGAGTYGSMAEQFTSPEANALFAARA